jgi:FtsH-binding integral membrane protein
MESQNETQHYAVLESASQVTTKDFIAKVFTFMFFALGVSALFAYWFSNSPELMGYLINDAGTGLNAIGYIVMFAPLGFVLLMSIGYAKFSSTALLTLFIVYAAITGISFSFILLAYSSASIFGCFISASVMFGVMAIMGYTTSQDLTSFGRLMIMGLIGIVIASLINLFLKSDTMGYVVSVIGVLVFTGLTAYDVQKLKRIGEGIEQDGLPAVEANKRSVMGALTLYLDFINLFLMLLRLFGGKRN